VKPTVQAAKVTPDGMMQQQWEERGRSADSALDAIVKPPKPVFRGVSQELGAARSGVVVMPKLVIGAPGDRYEQEADRVAQQVVQQVNTPTVEATQPEESAIADLVGCVSATSWSITHHPCPNLPTPPLPKPDPPRFAPTATSAGHSPQRG
jgi:hypothetical protein